MIFTESKTGNKTNNTKTCVYQSINVNNRNTDHYKATQCIKPVINEDVPSFSGINEYPEHHFLAVQEYIEPQYSDSLVTPAFYKDLLPISCVRVWH